MSERTPFLIAFWICLFIGMGAAASDDVPAAAFFGVALIALAIICPRAPLVVVNTYGSRGA